MRFIVALLAAAACTDPGGDKAPEDGTCTDDSWFVDEDGDGFGGGDAIAGCVEERPASAVDVGGDCDDDDAAISPDGVETCNGIDDDCDGDADDDDLDDEPTGAITFYVDADGDGFGDPSLPEEACTDPGDGFADNDADCDDGNVALNPNTPWYADLDRDGFGNWMSPSMSCLQPPDSSPNPDDCDDSDDTIGAPVSWFEDMDMDGYGDPSALVAVACDPPTADAVANGDDCDDTSIFVSPDTVWFADMDGDGFGNAGMTTMQCMQPLGFVADDQDCDDTNALVEPGRFDFDDDLDNDCDMEVDEDVGAETVTSADIQALVDVECTPCHITNTTAGLRMSPSVWTATVGVASTQLPSMDRITPGDLDNSYLWRKITGTQLAAGGSGNMMPAGGSLGMADRALLQPWILQGAAL